MHKKYLILTITLLCDMIFLTFDIKNPLMRNLDEDKDYICFIRSDNTFEQDFSCTEYQDLIYNFNDLDLNDIDIMMINCFNNLLGKEYSDQLKNYYLDIMEKIIKEDS